MLTSFIDLFLKVSKPLHKFTVLLGFGLVLLITDQFTSYPSLSFTKDKYDAIEVLNRVRRDSTLNVGIRLQAEKEIVDISNRRSLRNQRHYLSNNIIHNVSNIAQISPPIKLNDAISINAIIKYAISWVYFVFCATCFYWVALVIIYRMEPTKPKKIRIVLVVLFFMVITTLLSILIIDAISTQRIYTTSLIVQLVFTMVVGYGLKLWLLLTNNVQTNK